MLSYEDVQILNAPFSADDHEFHRGNCYLKEQVIATRLDDVDPAWLLLYNETIVRGNKISVVVSLTVKGVTRVGVGQSDVLYMKDKTDNQGNVIEERSHVEANEAEKSAATDAFKRASRMFGIGRYILEMPKNISDEKGVGRWLQAQGKPSKPPAPTQVWHTVPSNLEAMQAMLAKHNLALNIEYAEVILNKSHTDYATGAQFHAEAIAAFDNQPKQNPLLNGTDKLPSQYKES